jgi:flagellar protein FliL
MAEDTARESPAGTAARSRKGAGRILAPAAAFFVLAAGGAAWLFGPLGPGTRAEAKGDGRELRSEVGALLALDPFIVNLADEDGNRYLKATVQLEFFGGRVPGELNARMPQIRDLLLTLFTSKVFADIRAVQGKAELRDEITNRVNHALRRDLVKNVYFTEFVVQ